MYLPSLYSYIPNCRCNRGSYTSLWYRCLACVQVVHLVAPLCPGIQCIAFDFTGGLSLSLFYLSPEFDLHTLPLRGADPFFFIPLLLLPLPFTYISCIIFPMPPIAFIFLVVIKCVSFPLGAGSLFTSGGKGHVGGERSRRGGKGPGGEVRHSPAGPASAARRSVEK